MTSTKRWRTTTIRDKKGKYLTEEQNIDFGTIVNTVQNCKTIKPQETQRYLSSPATNIDDYPILREEVEAAVKALKKAKSEEVESIPGEVAQSRGEATINALAIICNKVWQTREWPTPWTHSLVTTLP